MHLHDPALFLSVQSAFDPQGEGLHGSGLCVGTLGGPKKNNKTCALIKKSNLRVVIL